MWSSTICLFLNYNTFPQEFVYVFLLYSNLEFKIIAFLFKHKLYKINPLNKRFKPVGIKYNVCRQYR